MPALPLKAALRKTLKDIMAEFATMTRQVVQEEVRGIFGSLANGSMLPTNGARGAHQNGSPRVSVEPKKLQERKSPMKGRHLNMDCRVARCTQRSKGPKFHFMCERHLKELPPSEQRRANQEWKERQARS